jgi:hypothetical protein
VLLEGSCHCGRIGVAFETDLTPDRIPLRACSCSFCRLHGARTATDRAGSAVFRFDEADVSRYRFELRTADFLVCRHCGVYVGAFVDGFATLNVNTLADAAKFTHEARAVNYDGETGDERLRRRQAAWTPARIEPPSH